MVVSIYIVKRNQQSQEYFLDHSKNHSDKITYPNIEIRRQGLIKKNTVTKSTFFLYSGT